MVSQYLKNCRSDLDKFKTALTANQYERARRLDHRMKGTGKPYGLTQIGRAIEWAASKQTAPELDSRIQRLEACLNSIELTAEQG